ncbi:16S rRNA (cytidine(1402)-2'-O)-methyltransferase [Candidatus Berkiella cookevillensis]|uniref:Ribosomal RNA small subunit methyltransferase I n=1 Tax=Candidatus Berkiella cookevillensis TaxID=437022 RepID=A0A0Q9YNK2_9GAMM|nr:16S rRNA (cytidine(1402)-2'-O)-methyltransferase [Candidatus Berkiella cookevillensis]MCS5708129.1 16S rRNA (cytidine(1402)-2'-O)-methyltransferase [Candidatus Berkiella cookevillensis]
MIDQTGKLYVVATPIGNLDDLSFRANTILKQVDWIAAEDTRQSKKLLDHYHIQKKLISLHNFNEKSRITQLIESLKAGQNGALISDAGTPCISDPGAHLIQALHEDKISVVPIPGACALISALSVAGFSTTEFLFLGFLPAKSVARKQQLETIKNLPYTIVFYEAPHRISEMLYDCKKILGEERRVVVARELTKKYETLYVSTLKNLSEDADSAAVEIRGEFVVIIEGVPKETLQDHQQNDQKANKILTMLLAEMSVKSAVNIAAEITDCPKNKLYDLAIAIQNQS